MPQPVVMSPDAVNSVTLVPRPDGPESVAVDLMSIIMPSPTLLSVMSPAEVEQELMRQSVPTEQSSVAVSLLSTSEEMDSTCHQLSCSLSHHRL